MSSSPDAPSRGPVRRIVVVGGSGFVGSRLCPKLSAAGNAVTILDKRPPANASVGVTYIQGDIRNADAAAEAFHGCDLVYNLAAEHHDDVRPVSLYDEVNVEGATNICRAATRNGVQRIVFTSSVAVYGSHPGPMDEATPHDYFNDYGRTKHLAELEYLKWLELDPNNKLTIVRPTVVFGPGNRANVYNFLKQLKHGPFVMFGSGLNIKSVAHVENVSSFLAFLADKPSRHAVFNYADQPDYTMRDLVRRIDVMLGRKDAYRWRIPQGLGLVAGHSLDLLARATGRKFPVSAIRIQKFCASSQISPKAALDMGFRPPVDLDVALRDMVLNHV